ncbi:MAG: diacylglycerol kinase family protein [Vicingaceae bacterium]
MKLLMVINPKAGSSDKIDFVEEAKEYAKTQKVDLGVYWTNGKTDEANIAQLIKEEKFDRLLAAGGDGTIRMAAIVIKNSKSKSLLGIVPLGTSNGLATDLHIPQNPIKAFKAGINSSTSIDLDFICVNGADYILHIGDLGANANLIKRFEKDHEEGYAAYTKHLIEELQDLGSFDYNIDCDGEIWEGSAQMIAFCNARKFGSGIPLTLSGHPGDGKFEIVIYKEINFTTLVKSTLSTLNENFFEVENREIIECESAKIQLRPKVIMQLDGELYHEVDKVSLKIEKAQIELICSIDSPY